MATQIQLRRGTAAAFTSANPVLAQGEPGYETDTAKWKVGDGTTAWTSLAYMASGGGGSPTGSAGGVLGGTYPNPSFAVDMATQVELDAVSATATGAIPKSLVDAAGDLLVGSADNTLVRLAKSTDGKVLTLVSGAVAWADPAGGSGGGRTVSSITYASTITPALPTSGDAVYNVGALTGNITVAAPTGTPADGQLIKFRFVQDGTGGRTFTFNSVFAFGTDVQLAMFPTAASAKFEAVFEYSSTDSKWRCVGVVRGF